jgi:hypothetical protein
MHVVQQWCESEYKSKNSRRQSSQKLTTILWGIHPHLVKRPQSFSALGYTICILSIEKEFRSIPSLFIHGSSLFFLFFFFPPIYQKLGKFPPPKKSFAYGLPNVTEAFMGLGVTLSNF